MQIIELKTNAEEWHAIDAGVMTAQVRRDDRDYARGDLLALSCLPYTPVEWVDLTPPSFLLLVQVDHVYRGGRHGIEDGYVLLSHHRVTLGAP